MAGSVMVSYAKARAESLIGSCEVGFWERPERIVLMILGALTNRMELALWLLAIGPNITVVHRILDTWRRTKDIEKLADAAQPAAESARAAQAAKAASEVRGAPVFTRHAGRGA
jgi:CDP-diacylglycerol--glycerol-3-phosphate 3-phosphatidyltransferase